ncbi:MAG: FAD-dependent oxidoreductase, partial [Alphaproteobacteria bacterium]
MTILPARGADFEMTVPVLVIGAGACGLIAAMSATEAGAGVVVLERDATPRGSTALSSGMIPAAGTRIQRAKGIEDTPELLIQDVMAKNHGLADAAMVETIARASGPTIDWLADEKGVELALVEGFLYPGTSRLRMHAPPDKTGASLMGSLTAAAASDGIDILTSAVATALFADAEGRVAGARIERPDGGREDIGCDALILACNGFGGNPEMVREHIPEMTDALYFGHPGNRGDAVIWGRELGAAARHMTAYQGHGSVAHPHSVLITWALMMAGGIQVNQRGERFSNEHKGYSEQSVDVLEQPGHLAWNIFDARLHALGMTF